MQKNCLHETQMRGGRAHGAFKDWGNSVWESGGEGGA